MHKSSRNSVSSLSSSSLSLASFSAFCSRHFAASNTLIAAAILVTSVGCATANAANKKDSNDKPKAEVVVDKAEKRRDHRQIRQDRLDKAKLEALLVAFDKARAANDVVVLTQIDQDLVKLLFVELKEDAREVKQDINEAERSAKEKRQSNREAAKEGQVEARADKRDDRRDKRDDIKDARGEVKQLVKREDIAIALEPLLGLTDATSLEQKRGLIVQLIEVAKQEIKGDVKELQEDRRETREDRKEVREDKREERREKRKDKSN